MRPEELRNKLSPIEEEYPTQVERIFSYLAQRDRHRNRTNIRQLYYPMKTHGAVLGMPQKVFREIFKALEEVGLGNFYKEGKDWFFEWYYQVSSIGKFYLGEGKLEKSADHPHLKEIYSSIETPQEEPPQKENLLADPETTKDWFQGHPEESFEEYDGHKLVIDLRRDFKVSMVLPKDLKEKEAERVIKFIRASIAED